MKHTEFFQLQAGNLLRDFKTQYQDEGGLYQYKPRFFNDIDDIILEYDIDEEKFTLQKAQHIIALMVGLNKWSDLIRASEKQLQIAKLLFENRDKINIDEYRMFEQTVRDDVGGNVDDDFDLESLNVWLQVDKDQREREAKLTPVLTKLLKEFYKKFPTTKLQYGWYSGNSDPTYWEIVTPERFGIMLDVRGVSSAYVVVGAKQEQESEILAFMKKLQKVTRDNEVNFSDSPYITDHKYSKEMQEFVDDQEALHRMLGID